MMIRAIISGWSRSNTQNEMCVRWNVVIAERPLEMRNVIQNVYSIDYHFQDIL